MTKDEALDNAYREYEAEEDREMARIKLRKYLADAPELKKEKGL